MNAAISGSPGAPGTRVGLIELMRTRLTRVWVANLRSIIRSQLTARRYKPCMMRGAVLLALAAALAVGPLRAADPPEFDFCEKRIAPLIEGFAAGNLLRIHNVNV